MIYFADDPTGITTVLANGNEYIGDIDLSELVDLINVELRDNRMTSLLLPEGNTLPITNINIQGSQFTAIDLENVNFGGLLTLGTRS